MTEDTTQQSQESVFLPENQSALSQVIKINEALISSLVGSHDEKLNRVILTLEKFELMIARLFDRLDGIESTSEIHNKEMMRIEEIQADIDLMLHEIRGALRIGEKK